MSEYIKWKMINDADIFKYCEDITGEYGGPYAVKIKKSKISYVKKINTSDYH